MKFFAPVLFLLMGLTAFSQDHSVKGIVVGNIIDTTTGAGLTGITIRLQSLKDTSRSKFFLSAENGAFEISDIDFGYYSLTFSGVGYSRIKLDSIHFRSERYDFNLGDIKMYPEAKELETVIIYAEKPLIENRDGTIIYNVGESALSAAASTAEILKTMPLISANEDGKILLKGREPRIMIDNRPTNLTSQQLNDLLEAMPGGIVDKIELMSNPPSEYASETGGVINIITKKGKVGFTGRVNLYYGTLGDANLSTNLSYRDKKWILQVTAGAGQNTSRGENNSIRESFFKDSSNNLKTFTNSKNKGLRPNLRISSDYEFNKQNLWNVTAGISGNIFDNNSETNYQNFNRLNELYRFSTRTNGTSGLTLSPTLSTNYRWLNKKQARESLNLYAELSGGKYENERIFYQLFRNPDGSPTGNDSTQRQTTRNDNISWEARASYNKPLSRKILLNSGFTIADNNFHNRLLTEVLSRGSKEFTGIDSLSPRFRYFQNIYTFRGGVTIDLKNSWRIITGALVENTAFSFDFANALTDRANKYWNLLPNLSVRKEWKKSGFNTSVSYRKTIRRPTLTELNPSVDYSNPYSIRSGNIFLTPQLSNNFDWSAGLFKNKYSVNVSAGYNRVKDIIQRIRTLDAEDKTMTTYMNIINRQEFEGTIWGAYTISKKLRLNAGAGYSYDKYDKYDAKTAVTKFKDGASYYGNINGNYILNDRITFDANIRYNSIADAQGRARSTLKQIFGVQTKWLKKRMTIGLTAIDPFRQQQYTTITEGKNNARNGTTFRLENNYLTRTRNFRISVSYNLTKSPANKIAERKKAINNAVKKVSTNSKPAKTTNPAPKKKQ